MAKAFQCDRCGKLVAGSNSKVVAQYGYVGKELCEECFEEYKRFIDGATLGLCADDVRYLFNTLNDAWAFNKQGFDEVCECSNCFHKDVCDSYSQHSDASMCNRFVSKYSITLGEEKREKLMKAVEKCLDILDSNHLMGKEDYV